MKNGREQVWWFLPYWVTEGVLGWQIGSGGIRASKSKRGFLSRGLLLKRGRGGGFQTYFEQMENKEQGEEEGYVFSSRSTEFLLFGQFFRSDPRLERRLSFSLTETKVSRVRCKRSSKGRVRGDDWGGERGCNDALWSIRRRVTWAEVSH